ncbi:DUF262 domain-containing protein [Bradyrhizobium yuanmingense]|uniref:DUF262 domain-containing protein n=1 Tax=Bradyrhizobium yuanmingense TaxID=108015 RepID=UPI0023B9D463|nr:DUF262 domain-containing HNH endonuclease family protein [Bradyrhizobium yuanmingense]MDF0579513.1 DUF262 domain-containing HNH endonuclease family protein [Bradyrhizobium yuanmingense]
MKFTPTSLTINQLFNSANEQYLIPTYQSRYSWTQKQIWDLIEDVGQIEAGDQHLLGMLVCLAGHHKAGLNQLEVVDGQQRLTTIVILLECIRQRFEKEGLVDAARDISMLLQAVPPSGKSEEKVLLDSIDAEEFKDHVAERTDRTYINERLYDAFRVIREEAIEDAVKDYTIKRIQEFVYKLRNQAVVVRLDVSEARDAFKLFETINNRGLRLSPTDIVKNFLLGNAARFGDKPLNQARKSWAELLQHLDGINTDAFLRYYLMSLLRVRVKKVEVVSRFKSLFMTQVAEAAKLPDRHNYPDTEDSEDDDEGGNGEEVSNGELEVARTEVIGFSDFLERLVQSARCYGEIELAKTSDARINRHLRNLRMIKAAQTNGFLMHLRAGGCDDKQFREVLKLTENFVLRRHVCRERSNETESLFARLCSVDPKNPIEETKSAYRELCPTDDKFKVEFSGAAFTSNLIERARYCLERIEVSKHGKHDELQVLGASDVHVEHIMPQKIKTKKVREEFGDWASYLGSSAESQHPKYVDRIGNLTLFAGTLNIEASNNPFARKKAAYRESSILLTNELAKRSNFRFKDIEKRSTDLAELAVKLWPRP